MAVPKFSIVLITKNEEKTLPRLFKSLEEFLRRGGDVSICDTGSTDSTVSVAKEYGATVYEVGAQFIKIVDKNTVNSINKKFVSTKDLPVINKDNKLFNFAEARNWISGKAKNDFIVTMDADEAYTNFDIDYIDSLVIAGIEQLEYQFVYAHNPNGSPAIQFIQSKAFDRRKMKWQNIVHEMLVGEATRLYVEPDKILLEHYQEIGKDHRGNYLTGLALDCYLNPTNDRNSHYFAREMMYTGRYRSAIKEFQKHVEMDGWQAEKAQSFIFIGDCYGYLNEVDKQKNNYQLAFNTDSSRREALIKMAFVYKAESNWNAVAAYAAAALEIKYNDYYANDQAMYQHIPHELLYEAKGFLGDIPAAQYHLMKCLDWQPFNPKFIHDTKFFFEYPCSTIEGWMTFKEQLYLYNTAKKLNGKTIVEVGSWKGRSSNALLTGNDKGIVFCLDTWQGSSNIEDDTNWMAKQENILSQFKANTCQFNNLVFIQKDSIVGANDFADQSIDMIFIDANHTYEGVKADILAWLPKVKIGGLITGHDYMPNTWQEVIQAVDEILGTPVEIHDTIWVHIKK